MSVSIAMLGRSFVRLRIASLAFQIKTKLNTSFAFAATAAVFCQRVRAFCCRLICLLQKYNKKEKEKKKQL